MELRTWSTRTPADPAFAAAWNERLQRSPQAHFAMRLDYLAWDAGHNRPATAVLVDGPCAGAIVLREVSGGWVSGWPWRWQFVLESPAEPGVGGFSVEHRALFAEAAQRVVGAGRLAMFAPLQALPRFAGYRAGLTVFQSLAGSEEELFKRLDDAKRRNIKRAVREGIQVALADRPEQFQAFARLQHETEARRGTDAAPATPEPGEGWREWELPWMWLLVAERDGVVEAGSGFGICPGGTIDYRTNASSLAGKKAGANIMLGWEGIRRGRESGHHFLNFGGGSTRFKRELGGTPIEVWCGLGGGAAWALPNQVTASVRRARPHLAAWWRERRAGTEGKTR